MPLCPLQRNYLCLLKKEAFRAADLNVQIFTGVKFNREHIKGYEAYHSQVFEQKILTKLDMNIVNSDDDFTVLCLIFLTH